MSEENDNQTRSAGRRVFLAAGIVSAALILTRILGLLRDIIIRAYFGLDSIEATAYGFAIRFPDLIFNVVAGGALASAFIPTFTAYFVDDDEKGGWDLFSKIINLIIIVLAIIAAVTAYFAEPLLLLLYVSPEKMAQFPDLLPLSVRMLRVLLISMVIFGMSGVFMATLNARQHFLAPALAPALYNIGIIMGIVITAPNVMGLAYGAVIGALAHAAVQLPALRQKQARYRLNFDFFQPVIGRILVLMGPRVLGLSFSYLNLFFLPILTRPLVNAEINAIDTAYRVMLMPYSFLGQALGISSFPTFAELAASKQYEQMQSILALALRSILFI